MHEKTRKYEKTTALGMLDFSNILSKYKPDIGLTVADRYETIKVCNSMLYEIPYSFTRRRAYRLHRR